MWWWILGHCNDRMADLKHDETTVCFRKVVKLSIRTCASWSANSLSMCPGLFWACCLVYIHFLQPGTVAAAVTSEEGSNMAGCTTEREAETVWDALTNTGPPPVTQINSNMNKVSVLPKLCMLWCSSHPQPPADPNWGVFFTQVKWRQTVTGSVCKYVNCEQSKPLKDKASGFANELRLQMLGCGKLFTPLDSLLWLPTHNFPLSLFTEWWLCKYEARWLHLVSKQNQRPYNDLRAGVGNFRPQRPVSCRF